MALQPVLSGMSETAEKTDPALWERIKKKVTAGEKGGAPAPGERADAALWNSPGDARPEGPDRSAPPAVAEMSQTRKMIADISAGARKDLGPWRGSAGAEAPSPWRPCPRGAHPHPQHLPPPPPPLPRRAT